MNHSPGSNPSMTPSYEEQEAARRCLKGCFLGIGRGSPEQRLHALQIHLRGSTPDLALVKKEIEDKNHYYVWKVVQTIATYAPAVESFTLLLQDVATRKDLSPTIYGNRARAEAIKALSSRGSPLWLISQAFVEDVDNIVREATVTALGQCLSQASCTHKQEIVGVLIQQLFLVRDSEVQGVVNAVVGGSKNSDILALVLKSLASHTPRRKGQEAIANELSITLGGSLTAALVQNSETLKTLKALVCSDDKLVATVARLLVDRSQPTPALEDRFISNQMSPMAHILIEGSQPTHGLEADKS